MSKLTDQLAERRNGLVEQMTQIATSANADGRSIDGETLAKFDTIQAEVDGIDQRLKALYEGEQRARDIETSFRPTNEQRNEPEVGAFGKWARDSRNGDQYDL